jgi:hypothetical protein
VHPDHVVQANVLRRFGWLGFSLLQANPCPGVLAAEALLPGDDLVVALALIGLPVDDFDHVVLRSSKRLAIGLLARSLKGRDHFALISVKKCADRESVPHSRSVYHPS